jgi:4-amino-4-deoxy-L-arabinose transferase-like glycosyltransferase
MLALIVAASLAVRVAASVYWRPGAIESEGAEYARIAENLRHGVGYVGLATPGPEVNFPPLFPLLIAGTSFATHNYEWAGRLVSLLLGALLPLPVFGIASCLFNRNVGFIAAMLALLHPLLIHLSFAVLSEGPFFTVFLSAVYIVVRALNQSSARLWFLVGGAFGLSYLLRAEAFAAFAIAVVFALTTTEADPTVKCKRALAAIVVFLAFALPELVFIYRSTGKVRLEGKSAIFLYAARRISAAETIPGADYESVGGRHEVVSSEPDVPSDQTWQEKWAFFGIDNHLEGMGMAMRSFADQNRETQLRLKDLSLIGKGIGRNLPMMFRRLSSDWLGAPLLPALALLGALRRPWRGFRAPGRLFLMLLATVPFGATAFALQANDPRYSFVFVPLLCIWAANGLYEVGLWTRSSAAAAGWSVLARPLVSSIIPGLLGLAVIISPAKAVTRLGPFMGSATPSRIDKEVGLWIGQQQNRPVRIMDLQLPLAYHAGAQFSNFPYCSSELALQYLDAARVDYVVLRRGEDFTRYYRDWMTHGIPDHRAELLRLPSDADAKFVVYRWHWAGTFGNDDQTTDSVPR